MRLSRYQPIVPFAFAGLFLVIGFCLYYVRLAGTTAAIVIHFQASHGADVIGTAGDALGMLAIGTMMVGVNLAIASTLWRRNRALSGVTGLMTALIALLILVAICGIIAVN